MCPSHQPVKHGNVAEQNKCTFYGKWYVDDSLFPQESPPPFLQLHVSMASSVSTILMECLTFSLESQPACLYNISIQKTQNTGSSRTSPNLHYIDIFLSKAGAKRKRKPAVSVVPHAETFILRTFTNLEHYDCQDGDHLLSFFTQVWTLLQA